MSDSYSPMDSSLPGSSVHGILQARILRFTHPQIPAVTMRISPGCPVGGWEAHGAGQSHPRPASPWPTLQLPEDALKILPTPHRKTGKTDQIAHRLVNSSITLPKKFIPIFPCHLWKNSNELLGQSNKWLYACLIVGKLCLTLCMDHSLPRYSVHGIFQARILEWVVMPSSGDLPDQGLNLSFLHLLHWQADSLQLSHQKNPNKWLSHYILSYCILCQLLNNTRAHEGEDF